MQGFYIGGGGGMLSVRSNLTLNEFLREIAWRPKPSLSPAKAVELGFKSLLQ